MNFDNRGLIGTIFFHSILFIIILIFGFRTPLPLPGEQGILINFGDEETGMGKEEPLFSDKQIKQEVSQPKQEVVEKNEEQIMTQEHEDAPSIKKVEKLKEKKVEKKEQPVKEIVKTEPKKEAVVTEQPKTDPKALYTGRKTNTQSTGSEGIAGGTGNQGSPDGSVDTDYHGEGGGSGNRPGFTLDGRSALSLPVPQYDIQKEGKVVVEIKVDRDGNVVSATPGIKGSTTVDSYLLGVAKAAALRSRFNSKADAEPVQKGAITYIFRLK
jgi:colicin import membrane protein